MGQVTITIDKREYAITCEDGEEAHIIKLSRILDEKAKLLSQSIGLINENMMLAMVGLLLADENQELQKKGGVVSTDEIVRMDTQTAQGIDSESERIRSLIQSIKQL
ncbi:MAG: cell division protein ZapA [Pseudomonadota bacterium]|nr:cell division protein ZapA [Pseudomonadota bacterium]